MSKLVSVIIPTFNRKDTLRETLLSFSGQTFKDFEMIIADDGSTDGTGDMVSSLTLPYPIVHLWQKNSGRSAARNMGLEKAQGKIILFVDDHIIVDARLIEEHVKFHELYGKDNVKVVRGRVEFYDSSSKVPRSTSYLPLSEIKSSLDEQDPFRNFITNNISVNREALVRVGGFDEDFREYGLQDSECGFRLREAGYRFKKNPNAVGYIFGVGLTFENRCSRRRQVGRSSVLFFRKHPSLKVKLTLSTHLISLILYKLYSIFASRIKSQKGQLFYNFLTGIAEGFQKYKTPMRMASRFRRKKVLLLSHNSRLEGAPISLFLLAKNMDRNKYEPIFVTPPLGKLNEALKKNGIRTRDLFGPRFIQKYILRKIAEREGIELLHINTLEGLWAIDIANALRIPAILHVREDNKHPNFSKVKGAIQKVSRVIAISNWVKRSFDLPDNKARVIYNGVDATLFSPNIPGDAIRRQLNIGEHQYAVCQIGSISERKGSDTLIKCAAETIKQIKDVKFVLVGDYIPGEFFRPKFKKLMRQLNIRTNLILAGTRGDIPQVIAGMDVIVNASTSEPFGRTIVEGMAEGKAVIGTDVGGIPEIIVNGKTGILVPPNDPKALCDAVIKLLGNERERRQMGEEGRRRVEELFTIESHARAVEGVYEEVLGK